MANSHVSYLQTLAKEEAIAFVSSLQKVKEHLSHELHWMNEQVQQKTIQLKCIDTLLSEAVELGLLASNDVVTATPEIESTSSQIATSLPATLAATNGNSLAAETTITDATIESRSEPVSTASTAPPKRGKQRQADNTSSSKRSTKLPAAEKRSVTKPTTKPTATATATTAKKPGRPAKAASEPGKTSDSGFQQFLQANFQDKSMTDAVGEILVATKAPMNTDAIMAQLYTGLSGDPYQRAKSSLSNILSVGKTKGKWKSPGRGLYIGS